MASAEYNELSRKSSLECTEGGHETHWKPPNSPFIRGTRLMIVLGVSLAVMIALQSYILFILKTGTTQAETVPGSSYTSGQQKPRYESCGSSPAEARSRGCQYEIVTGVWELPECFDQELQDEYLHHLDWKWYEDEEMTQEIAPEVIALGEYTVAYAPQQWHLMHCGYRWLKQHKVYKNGGSLDQEAESLEHTRHCAHSFDTWPIPITPVRITPQYPGCIRVA